MSKIILFAKEHTVLIKYYNIVYHATYIVDCDVPVGTNVEEKNYLKWIKQTSYIINTASNPPLY